MVSFTPRPLYPRIGGWVGPIEGLDAVEKRKISPCEESNPAVQTIILRHTD
jgi:hypothetical protein